jgi:hypothetical protein
MADATPEPPDAGPDDPSSAALAAVANLSLRSARVTIDDLAGELPEMDGDAILDAIAALADAGWLTEWEIPGGPPGVCLSALGGRKMGLELSPDPAGTETRWVGRGASPEVPRIRRRSSDVRTISETDLFRADETPMSQMPAARQRLRVEARDDGPGLDRAAMAEADERAARLRALVAAGATPADLIVTCGPAAEHARFRAWLDGAWSAEEVIVLMGGLPWPLPGQDRRDGPGGADRPGVAGRVGPCPVCGGRKLARNEFCASPGCERSGFDLRVPPAIRAAVAESKRARPATTQEPKSKAKKTRKELRKEKRAKAMQKVQAG